jgi:hypothetical protein
VAASEESLDRAGSKSQGLGGGADTSQASAEMCGPTRHSNPFMQPREEGSFAARVRMKEWQIAGPPSAPACSQESPRSPFAGGGMRGNGNGPQQRGGPLADSVASLTVSGTGGVSQHTLIANPARTARHVPVPSGISGEACGSPFRVAAIEELATGGSGQVIIATRRSSGNPFKREESPRSTGALRSPSGNPFINAHSQDLPFAAPRGTGSGPAENSSSSRRGSMEAWPSWHEDARVCQLPPQNPMSLLPPSPQPQKAS